MTPLMYFVQVSLYAGIMCGIYFLVWRNRPLHRYSRIYLLASLVFPVILPAIRLPAGTQYASAVYSVTLSPMKAMAPPAGQPSGAFTWTGSLAWIYLAGCLVFVVRYAMAYLRLYRKLRNGRRSKQPGYTLITGTGIGPGTLGRRVFFPFHETDEVIIRHELAHIRAGHRYDSALLQVLHVALWISPAHWILGRELKTVHEFEADSIASEGLDTAEYASLLLSQSLGTPHSFAIAHSFFRHPLNRRIMMLQKLNVPKRSGLILTSAVLTTAFLSTVLLAQTKGPSGGSSTVTESQIAAIDMNVVARNTPRPSGEIQLLGGGGIAFKKVDQMPAFRGNMYQWLRLNMLYPDAARAERAKDGCLLQFTVAENGTIVRPQILRSSGDAELDNEALRVVGKMPDWKPGTQQGRAVPVVVTLAIFFDPNMTDGC